MKKLMIALACVFAACSMSQLSAKEVIEKVYYGERANNSIKNPCSGTLVRICYKETTTIDDGSNGSNSVVTIVGTNAEGVEVYSNSYVTSETTESIVKKIVNEVPSNAEVTVTTH